MDKKEAIDRELTEEERVKILKEQEVVVDTVVIGDEVFNRSSYMFAGEMSSHVHGCFSHRFYEAMEREGVPPKVTVVKVG